MEKSKIAAHGKIIDNHVNIDFIEKGKILIPDITTTWTFEVQEMIKGEPSKQIQFLTEGGKYNNMEHISMDHIDLAVGDKLIVFLDKTPSSVWGGDYYLAGIESGVYKINNDGDKAKNHYLNKSFDLVMFKAELKSNKHANK